MTKQQYYSLKINKIMKKLFLLLVALMAATMSFAQNSGLGFNYQAVVRNVGGLLLSNSDVTLRISLYPGQTAATPTWVETHNVHTDVSGCFGITVGHGTRQTGSIASSYSDINFAAVYYWMKIEILEGSSYREVSFSQLPSTPYSEVAHNASSFAGMIAPFAGPVDKIPAGWLLCDGREVNRSEYANLYNVIGICWGEGNGSTTFNLPDLRGMFLRGVSGDSGNDEDAATRVAPSNNGGNTGNNVGSYQGDAIRNITGSVKIGDALTGVWNDSCTGFCGYEFIGNMTTKGGGSSTAAYNFTYDASRVVPVASDNHPKNVYVNYIIKY